MSPLFSSPHLVEVRERLCIDGNHLEKDKFTQYFWEVYNRLDATKVLYTNIDKKLQNKMDQ